jgi:hypothetical protein
MENLIQWVIEGNTKVLPDLMTKFDSIKDKLPDDKKIELEKKLKEASDNMTESINQIKNIKF